MQKRGEASEKIRKIISDLMKNKEEFSTSDVIEIAFNSGNVGSYSSIQSNASRILRGLVENGKLVVEKKMANGSWANIYKTKQNAMKFQKCLDKDQTNEGGILKAMTIHTNRIFANMDELIEKADRIQMENAKISEWLFNIERKMRDMEKSMEIIASQMQSTNGKPKATSPKKEEERQKHEINDDLGGGELYNITSKNPMILGEEEYDRYINTMIKYIVARTEGSTAKQIKCNLYKEMHREYGYSDSGERKRFLQKNGRQATSGTELMYDNEEFRLVYYYKVADHLSKLYGL